MDTAKTVTIIVALIGVPGTIIGAFTGWYGLTEKKRCYVSGRVADSLSGQPAERVRVGYQGSRFRVIAVTGADGSYGGSCEGAGDETGESSIELVTSAQFQGGGLPCLRTYPTGVRIKSKGRQESVNLQAPSRC